MNIVKCVKCVSGVCQVNGKCVSSVCQVCQVCVKCVSRDGRKDVRCQVKFVKLVKCGLSVSRV